MRLGRKGRLYARFARLGIQRCDVPECRKYEPSGIETNASVFSQLTLRVEKEPF